MITPSPGQATRKARLDAEFLYGDADPFNNRCGVRPIPRHSTVFQIDLGSGFSHIEPIGGAPSVPDSDHRYSYLVTGQGAPAGFQLAVQPTSDNFGILTITVELVDDVPADHGETVLLNSWEAADDGTAGPVSTVRLLEAGRQYLITVDGNYSEWPAGSPLKCGVEDEVMTPSPGQAARKARVDAEFFYGDADPFNNRCGVLPIPRHLSKFEFDVGSGFSHFEPIGGAPSVPDPDHRYSYLVTGQGSPARFQLATHPTSDNFGMLTITVELVDGAPSVTPPADQSSHEGALTAFDLGSFTDAGADAPWGVTVEWGDGSAPTAFEVGGIGSLLTKSHIYDDNGSYEVTTRVTDKDGAAASATFEVSVTNVAPVITTLTGPVDPLLPSSSAAINATFVDASVVDSHTCTIEWGDGTTSAGTVDEVDGSGTCTDSRTYAVTGVYIIGVTVSDDDGGISLEAVHHYAVIYDPDGGFVTGAGWITSPPGAYRPDEGLTGRANFGFVSKYQHGTNTPTGSAQFRFRVAGLIFSSGNDDQEWLVVGGVRARFKGNGTINGAGDYGFMLTAVDNGNSGDTFRIKIWDKDAGDGVVYDNKMGSGDDAYDGTVIGGGNIKVHSK